MTVAVNYPRAELVTHLLRPLRSKASAHLPCRDVTLREILDGIIIASHLFCLEGDRKAPRNNALLADGISRITVKSGWKR